MTEAPNTPPARRCADGVIDPRCAICGDAYGSRYVCESCRNDPANDRWDEGAEMLTITGEVESTTKPWSETREPAPQPRAYNAVVQALLADPYARIATIARRAGCSRQYASRIVRDLVGAVAA